MDADFAHGAATTVTPTPPRHLVAVPYPGRGHVNPMINLCELLLSSPPTNNLIITVVVTEEWLGFLTAAGSSYHPAMRFRSIPNVIPSELNRAADFSGFVEAVLTKMESPFEELLPKLDPPPVAIVADTYISWVVSVGNRHAIPVYSVFTMSPSVFSVLYHFDLLAAHGHLLSNMPEKRDESLEHIPGITSLRLSDIHSILGGKTLKLALPNFPVVRKAQGILFSTFYELEPSTIDALKAQLAMPVYTIGPSIPFLRLLATDTSGDNDYSSWLDSQPQSSVLYVSLGSFLSVSREQVDEMMMGLLASGVRFLWVARGDSSRLRDISGGGMGLVVPWCDQLRVLCHPSVGAFLTHCGWNSTLEGVFSGKPMLTFPLFWDQPPDSALIADVWKIGLKVKKGTDGFVTREEIAEAAKKVMDLNRDESKAMRRRAEVLKEKCHGAIKDDGSSMKSINAFKDVILQGI